MNSTQSETPVLDPTVGSAPAVGGATAQRDVLEVAAVVAVGTVAVAVAQQVGPATGAGNAAALVGLVLCMGLVLLFHRLRGDGWGVLGLARPASWPRTLAAAVGATVVIMAAAVAFQSAVQALVTSGATPDTSRFDALRGNLPALLGSLVSIWVTAAFGEELINRGFMMGRLARVFGGGRGAWIASLLLCSSIFGVMHLYQGLAGVLVTGFVGLLLGALYLLVRRNLWVGILAHGLIDTISLTLVFAGVAG